MNRTLSMLTIKSITGLCCFRLVGTLYLSRIAGGEISHEEARDVLKDYGAIEELHYASSTDRALYGLPQGTSVFD